MVINGAGQQVVTLDALLEAAQVSDDDVSVVGAADDAAATAALLDVAVRETPAFVILTADDGRASEHADAWASDRAGWLVLADPIDGATVLAAVDTLAGAALPGRWRGGRRHATRATVAASSARAALVDTQRNEADRLQAELVEERAWVAAEAERVRDSHAWRVGHRVVRTARLLTLRRDRGTDALSRLIERMNAPREP